MNKKKLITHGMPVRHKKYGVGIVMREWGPIEIHHGDGRSWNQCDGIFDVIFKWPSGDPFLHCCRGDMYLTKVGK